MIAKRAEAMADEITNGSRDGDNVVREDTGLNIIFVLAEGIFRVNPS